MERKRITCPETGFTEEIELARTPCGIIIGSCSRFVPGENVRCAGECARELDREDGASREACSERVLVVASDTLVTRPAAEQLVAELRRDGLVVDLADADGGGVPPPEDYDAVVVGTAPLSRRLPRSLVRYIAENRDALTAMPSFLFCVGRLSALDVGAIAERTGWLPKYTAAFARGKPDADAVHMFALAIGDAVPAELV